MRVASRRTKARSWLTNSSAPPNSEHHLLEPGDRLDVEMIGRLVEQQQVRLPRPAPGRASRAAASRRTARSSAHRASSCSREMT
jgi:hypothetical protein